MPTFKEIPKYTSVGSYQINMPLMYFERWIKEMQEDCNLDLEPDFQRGHVWAENQQIAYVEHLLKGGKSGRILYFNCPNWNDGGCDDFVCVDGLQRITAILRFLRNEIPAFGFKYMEYTDKIPIDIDVLININNLKTRKEVLTWYIEINKGGTPHTSGEIAMVKALLERERNK